MFDPDPSAEARIRDLESKMNSMPGSRVFVGLAEEYRRAGRLNEALGVLRQGLQVHPNYLSAQIAIARLFRELGRSGEAIEAFSKVLVIDRENLVAAKALADLYWDMGNRVEAIKKFKLYRAISGDRSYDERIAELEREIRVEAPPEVSKAPPTLPTDFSAAIKRTESVAPMIPPPSFGFEELSLEASDFRPTEPTVRIETIAPDPTVRIETIAPEPPAAAPPAPAEEAFDPNATMSISLTQYPEPGPAAIAAAAKPEAEPSFVPEAPEVPEADDIDDADDLFREPAVITPPPDLEPLVPMAAEAEARSESPASHESIPEPAEIISQEPEPIPPSKTLADLYFEQGYFEDARVIYEKLLQADPTDPAVAQRLSELKGTPATSPVRGGPAERDLKKRQAARLRTWLSRVQSNARLSERA